MPQFYFDFHGFGGVDRDGMGMEFENVETAYLAAFRAAQEMWSELLIQREDPRRCSFNIRDDQDRVVFVIPFSETLDACFDRSDSPSARSQSSRNIMKDAERARQDGRRCREEAAAALNSLEETRRLIAQFDDVANK
jgi:hypothetical protein